MLKPKASHYFFLIVFLASALGGFASDEDPNIPPMPSGYQTEAGLLIAFTAGQIPTIDAKNIQTPDNIKEILGIEYGKVGDRSLQLDLYVPEHTKPVPGIIFIHGGGWYKGNRNDMKFYTVEYAKKGYVTATISYRFSDDAPYPAAIEDAKCAVRWMRANAKEYNIDPDQIGISGNSAGGHLSMMVGYSSDDPTLDGNGGYQDVSSRVQAVVDFYGPVDLTTDFAIKQDSLIRFMDGKLFSEVPENYKKASPLFHISPDDPPTLIFHGTIDSIVPIAQADTLAEKLKENGIPYVYDRFEGWPHTMDLVKAINERCVYRMDQHFAKYLPLPK